MATILAACTKDATRDLAVIPSDAITVAFENDSRIQLDANCKTVWNADDKVSVFYKSDANDCWRFCGNTGDKSGILLRESQGSATVANDKIVIAYPYNSDYVISTADHTITAYIPKEQNYLNGSYDAAANIMVSSGTENTFILKNTCGWLRLQLKGNGAISKIKLKGNAGEQIAGKVIIDYETLDMKLIKGNPEIGDNTQVGGTLIFEDEYVSEITLDCKESNVELNQEIATDFYIALAPQTFAKGISVTTYLNNGSVIEKSTDNTITVERNHIVPMGEIECESADTGLPVNFTFNNLRSSMRNGQYWENFGFVMSDESGFYEDGASGDIDLTSEAFVQFVCGTEQSTVKTRTNSDGINGCGLTVTSLSPKVIGMYEGDYWIWTIPVRKLPANANMRCEFTFMGTDAGVKYFFFESAQCSKEDYLLLNTDMFLANDADKCKFYESLFWTTYDKKTISVPNDIDKAQRPEGIPIGSASSPAGYWKGDITYSEGFSGANGGKQINVDKVVNFTEPMEEGYLFVRLRAASNLTCGPCNATAYQRISLPTHNGTNYLRQTAKFSFDGYSEEPPYNSGFKYYAVNDIDGCDIVFTDDAQMGLFAGTEKNIISSYTGNNRFGGDCPTNQNGNPTYAYSPYTSDSNEASHATITVPAEQKMCEGNIVGDSTPLISTNAPNFQTTSMMRLNFKTPASVLQLGIYSATQQYYKISSIEISADSDIAGSRDYDLINNNAGEFKTTLKSLSADAIQPIDVAHTETDAAKTYIALWSGEHKLTVKIHVGYNVYTKELPSMVFEENKISSITVNLDDCTKTATEGAELGIANAEQFRQFCQDVLDGKNGSALDQYRNVDGELGFGGAVRDEDRVIDMAGIDMITWPKCNLPEDFNGGNYVIKNLNITNIGYNASLQMSVALFNNIEYGYTLSNITFDKSCKMELDINGTYENNWAFLVAGEKGKACGNIYNIVNYGDIDMFTTKGYGVNVGAIIAVATCSDKDTDDQSTIKSCRNYGELLLHDISTDKGGSYCWSGYKSIGGLIGMNRGMIVENCENHGQIIMENIECKTGAFYIGGIVGYNTNRTENNSSMAFGLIRNCSNYGEVNIGRNNIPIKIYNFGLGGICGRMQWGNLDGCTNYANMKAKAIAVDSWGADANLGYYTYPEWETQISTLTNSLGFFSIGGIFAFCQNNIITETTFANLSNSGNIQVECDQIGKITYADNTGISVGGISGRIGANAYNPHFDGCSNTGSVSLKSNTASAETFVGGICGHFAGNRYSLSYIPYCNESSNSGAITFATDNAADVIAHAGGICGAAIYGEICSCINTGTVNNASTNESSSAGSILGTQHRSTISPTLSYTPAFIIHANAAGGSVNGVTLNKDNYMQYIHGGYESYEPSMSKYSGENSNYFYDIQ